jgi:hypothetical protein
VPALQRVEPAQCLARHDIGFFPDDGQVAGEAVMVAGLGHGCLTDEQQAQQYPAYNHASSLT